LQWEREKSVPLWCQPQAVDALPLKNKAPSNHSIGGWVGSRESCCNGKEKSLSPSGNQTLDMQHVAQSLYRLNYHITAAVFILFSDERKHSRHKAAVIHNYAENYSFLILNKLAKPQATT
jgi:hypothetical protein